MTINTVFSLGEQVYIKCLRGKDSVYVQGEIIRICISGSSQEDYNIRYTVRYLYSGEVYTSDKWESDLVREELTGSAMPKLLVIVPPKETE